MGLSFRPYPPVGLSRSHRTRRGFRPHPLNTQILDVLVLAFNTVFDSLDLVDFLKNRFQAHRHLDLGLKSWRQIFTMTITSEPSSPANAAHKLAPDYVFGKIILKKGLSKGKVKPWDILTLAMVSQVFITDGVR
jgi:hypothetical protein